MKKFISVLVLVCIMASFCTVSAFAEGEALVDTEAELRAALLDSSITTITLEGSITVNAESGNNFALEIKRPVTINGNGNTIESSAGRVINVETTGEVTIENINITGTSQRGVNIINQTVTVNLNSVNITAPTYAVMLATSSASSTLNINGGTYTSNANTINIAGPSSKVTINNAVLITNDTNPNEDYGTVCTYVTAGGSQITVNGGSVTYNKNDGKGGTGRCLRSCSLDSFSYNTTMNGGGFEACVAYIEYPGQTAYAFSTIDGSIEKAEDGKTIEIIRDVDMGGQIVDVNKNITIDMNGKKITNGALKLAEGVTVTVVNWPGTEAELEQFLSGKLPVPNRYNVPSTADNSNMPLWAVLFIGFAAVALLTGKKRRA